jgi:hypothetical protein
MPFIGKQPEVGAYSKLDAITTSATATYNLTLGGGAYYPSSANHLLVSLNGVMQAPQDSFTVSGSTIVFASTLASTDSIDFIMALGDVLDIGTPSDGTVTTAKIQDDAITSAKIAGALTTTGTTGIGIGQEPHSTAAVGITTTDQHIRMTNGSELGILSVESDGNIQLWSHGDDATQFRTGSGSGTIAARIDADGLKFGTDTASANALNDYEVGTWTPTVNGLSGAASGYSSQVGHYTKIGNIVVAYFRFTLTNKGNISGNYALIQGLPFNHSGSDGGSGMVNRYTNLVNAVSSLGIELGGSSPSVAWLTKQSGTSGTSDTYVTTADIANNTFMQGSLIYRTS